MKSCFFIGHRNAPETLRPLLDAAIERHISEYGVTEFVAGHYGRFDYMAAGKGAPPGRDTHAALALLSVRPRHQRL